MQYLVSVIGDTPGRTTPEEQAAIEVFDAGSRRRVTGSSPVAWGRPVQPPSSTTGAERR